MLALAHIADVNVCWRNFLEPWFGSIFQKIMMFITFDPVVLRIYSAAGVLAPGQVCAEKHVKILIAAMPIILKD